MVVSQLQTGRRKYPDYWRISSANLAEAARCTLHARSADSLPGLGPGSSAGSGALFFVATSSSAFLPRTSRAARCALATDDTASNRVGHVLYWLSTGRREVT